MIPIPNQLHIESIALVERKRVALEWLKWLLIEVDGAMVVYKEALTSGASHVLRDYHSNKVAEAQARYDAALKFCKEQGLYP